MHCSAEMDAIEKDSGRWSPFDLSQTLPVGGALLVLCSLPGPPVIKLLMQVVTMLPGQGQIPYVYTVEVRNRFKGLDLIDRVPDELWMEICDIVKETGVKTIPMENK